MLSRFEHDRPCICARRRRTLSREDSRWLGDASVLNRRLLLRRPRDAGADSPPPAPPSHGRGRDAFPRPQLEALAISPSRTRAEAPAAAPSGEAGALSGACGVRERRRPSSPWPHPSSRWRRRRARLPRRVPVAPPSRIRACPAPACRSRARLGTRRQPLAVTAGCPGPPPEGARARPSRGGATRERYASTRWAGQPRGRRKTGAQLSLLSAATAGAACADGTRRGGAASSQGRFQPESLPARVASSQGRVWRRAKTAART